MKVSGTREAVEEISGFFDPHNWRGSRDGSYALGSYAFGALIEPRGGQYLVTVGRNLGWGQERDTVAQATFDTLEEAANFGMLIYTQNKPDIIDRTRVRGYPI